MTSCVRIRSGIQLSAIETPEESGASFTNFSLICNRFYMHVLFRNDWECDAKPRSPYKSCGLALINPQNLPKLALLACALVYIAHLVNGGFFYIDASNEVSYGACFSRGDLFSLCVNGMAISVVSVVLAIAFILKDFIMCGINSCSWMCWMQVVEGVTFLLLTVWWTATVSMLHAAQHDTSGMDATVTASNSSITVADNLLGDNHPNKLRLSLGYQLLGISAGCFISNGIWLLRWFICFNCRKMRKAGDSQPEPYLGMKEP